MRAIEINLLPWRDELQQEREDRLKNLFIMAALIGVLVGAGTWFMVGKYYDMRQERITRIEEELQKPIYAKAANDLKKREALMKDLENKLGVLNGLNTQRSVMLDVLEKLAAAKERGVALHALDFKADKVGFEGISLTQERLINFMKSLEKGVGYTPIPSSEEQRFGGTKLTLFGITIKPEIREEEVAEEENKSE